jgi:hypothetical protein
MTHLSHQHKQLINKGLPLIKQDILAFADPDVSQAWRWTIKISVFESICYIGTCFGFLVAMKVGGGSTMSEKNKVIVVGAIVTVIAGLGLALSTFHNAATLVASAVWGS